MNDDVEIRGKETMKVGIIGISGNVILFIIKILCNQILTILYMTFVSCTMN